MENTQITQKYFEYSNLSDFEKIAGLLSHTSTYSSQNTGLYVWVDAIIKMQEVFHNSFESLHWNTIQALEEKPGIIRVDFEFTWVKDWEKIEFSAIEFIIIVDGVIQHIEIRNK
jgi:hypothetical protein